MYKQFIKNGWNLDQKCCYEATWSNINTVASGRRLPSVWFKDTVLPTKSSTGRNKHVQYRLNIESKAEANEGCLTSNLADFFFFNF